MASPSPTDSMPNAWRKRIHPRRGYPSAAFTKVKPDRKAAAKLTAHLELLRGGLVVQSERAGFVLQAIDQQIAGSAPVDAAAAAAIGALARYRVAYEAKTQASALASTCGCKAADWPSPWTPSCTPCPSPWV